MRFSSFAEGNQQVNVHLPPEQQTFIDELVSSGTFSTKDEAISEGVRLLISQEELKNEIDIGIEQADRGELIDHDTVFQQLRAMASDAVQSTQDGQ